MEKWYRNHWSNVVKELETDIRNGLSDEYIESKRKAFGENYIKFEHGKRTFFKSIKTFFSLHILIQIALGGLLIFQKEILYGSIIFLIVIGKCYLDIYFNNKSEYKFKQIEKLNHGKARCIRNGRIKIIDAVEVVVGDIVFLEEGNLIHADMRIIESQELIVRESAVTGKDELVEKYEARIQNKVQNISEIRNILFKSSNVVRGECTGVVIAVGMDTEIGKIVSNANINKSENKVFQEIKAAVGRFNYQSYGIVLLGVLGAILKGQNTGFVLKFANLCFYTICLNIGVFTITVFLIYMKRNLAQKGINIHNIFMLDKIASVSMIILNDKEFLCENEAIIKELYTDETKFTSSKTDLIKEYNTQRMLQISVLSNNAYKSASYTEREKGVFNTEANDIALLKFSRGLLIDKNIEIDSPRLFEIPKDNEKKIMTTLNCIDDNYRANVKGDSEEILKRCTHIMKNGIEVEISESDIDNIKDVIIEMSSNVLKVIGLAYRNFNYEPSADENIESHLVFVGLIGLENSIKNDSISNLSECEKLNIKMRVITEDNKLFAFALGKKLGILKRVDQVLSGIELKYMNKDEQTRVINKIKIFSNIFSEDKNGIVKYYNDKNEITAITASTFNDLPAVSSAPISIACGEKCSGTIKGTSDVFINEYSFSSILDLIKFSRTSIANVNIALLYFSTVVFSEILLVMLQYLLLPSLNIDYLVVVGVNFIFIPLNMIFLIKKSKHKDEDLLLRLQLAPKIDVKMNLYIINAIKIVLLVVGANYVLNWLHILNSLAVIVVMVTLAQFIVKKSFKKYEIYKY